MKFESIYRHQGDNDVTLPAALEELFTGFVSDSGMPFAPQITHSDEKVNIHFLFLTKPLKELVDEFLARFEPDGFYTIEAAVANDRLKHAVRIAEESNWIPFVRQEGTDRTRVCFIRTPRSVPASELEERVELVG